MDCWSGKLGIHTYDKDEHHYSERDFEMHDWNAFRTLVDMNLSSMYLDGGVVPRAVGPHEAEQSREAEGVIAVAVRDEYQGYPPWPYGGCALHGELGRLAAIEQPRPGDARPPSPSLPSPAAVVLDAIPTPLVGLPPPIEVQCRAAHSPRRTGRQLAVPTNTTSMSLWAAPASIG